VSELRLASLLTTLAMVACASGRQATAVAWKAAEPANFEPPAIRVEVAAQESASIPPAPIEAPGPRSDAPTPTWSAIYARYLAPGTEGGCARSRGCHAEAMSDASSTYAWLAQRGYIAGAESALVKSNSCLHWFGGNMPPRGGANSDAARDLAAWVAAGAPNN
jgi:hypothetical protein